YHREASYVRRNRSRPSERTGPLRESRALRRRRQEGSMSDFVFGRDRLGDLDAATRLEWLVTNGIGGSASGTPAGAPTRREHGLLVAAPDPPRPRTLLLAKLSERIEIGELGVDLDTNRWRSGVVSPAGHAHLESFHLEGSVPVWTWAIAGAR